MTEVDTGRECGSLPAGTLFVLSAPSGAGKTTLCRHLLERFPDMAYSVSYTTRPPRLGEQNGRDYHFIDEAMFRDMCRKDQWAEWAAVHGHYYATAKAAIQKAIGCGRDMLLDIDVQGMKQIVARFPQAVTIFIVPPSMAVLRQRLEQRATDSRQTIEKRLANARREMQQRHLFEYVVVNDRLTRALEALFEIVENYRRTNI